MNSNEEMLKRKIRHRRRQQDGVHPHRKHHGAGPSDREAVETEPEVEAAEDKANPVGAVVEDIGEAAFQAVESKVADGAKVAVEKVVGSLLKGIKL